jgi:hypothetical protein
MRAKTGIARAADGDNATASTAPHTMAGIGPRVPNGAGFRRCGIVPSTSAGRRTGLNRAGGLPAERPAQ